jgi:large subunit ribosomal protein L20
MTRVKGGTVTRARHKRVLKYNKGNEGSRSLLFKRANETMLKGLWYAFRDRRARKRDLRKLWITRINAASRINGLSYSKLMHSMKKADIQLNRKMLADLAVRDPKAFSEVVNQAKAAI